MSCSRTDEAENKENKSKDIYVTTTKSKMMEFRYQESAIGSIEGIIDPTVASEVAGKITKIFVRPGTTVDKGQIMAEVDGTDSSYQLSLSEAEVKKLQARLNNQKITYERNLKLVDENFISPNALLHAPETRTSSPVRIPWTKEFNHPDCFSLYPCGEGAGYAGGIMSAAIDGIKCVEAILTKLTK